MQRAARPIAPGPLPPCHCQQATAITMNRTTAAVAKQRVLTRFVLKYTLTAQPEPSGAHEL